MKKIAGRKLALARETLIPLQLEMLRDIVRQVHQRAKVYERWGFGAKSGRGLGTSTFRPPAR